MDIETLNALRSPSGLPSHPLIFLVLLVLTWGLHILAVQVMLGSTVLSVFGGFSSAPHWRRLAAAMLDTAKVAISIAIVVGVAPLLFVQVIYDPFWYVSNVLSARWAIAFIGILLTAYWLLYHRYFSHGQAEGKGRISLAISLVLLVGAGFIMHVLTNQMLRPELWMQWYAPGGHIDPSGSGLHEHNLFRFGYFLALSLPVTGTWLVGYRRYVELGPHADEAYLRWVGVLAGRWMSGGGLLALLLYALWMSTLADSAKGFAVSAWSIVAIAATLLLAVLPLLFPTSSGDFRPFAAATVAVLLIAVAREALRIKVLGGHFDYDIFTYPVHFDAYSTLLFFLTFAGVGGTAVAFSIALSWEAGKTCGVYTASPLVARLGSASLVALGIWIAQYFLFGLLTLVR